MMPRVNSGNSRVAADVDFRVDAAIASRECSYIAWIVVAQNLHRHDTAGSARNGAVIDIKRPIVSKTACARWIQASRVEYGRAAKTKKTGISGRELVDLKACVDAG